MHAQASAAARSYHLHESQPKSAQKNVHTVHNTIHSRNHTEAAPVCSQHLQAITEAVNNGGSLAATRRAGYVGSSGSWAVTQGNRVFNVVDWQNTWGGKRKQ